MEISAENAIQLIADLWANKFPLVQKYFGENLSSLLKAMQGNQFNGRFVEASFFPEALEARLNRIEVVGQTKAILDEVGTIQNPTKLDARLLDAWAELRTIDQLRKEKFVEIHKVEETADLTASKVGRNYAFQVVRINKLLKTKTGKFENQNRSPYGAISDIHKRLDDLISEYFWNAIERKNLKYKKWMQKSIRCIVIVSSDKELQDEMIRHISCQQIRNGIHLLEKRYFDELIWLPDTGNGAWFKIGNKRQQTQCFADWKDIPDEIRISDEDFILRREVDLDTSIPFWKEEPANPALS
ncbi:MAG: hypothetical protein DRG33_07735 [Deltaproteobacteria bacterium]|nr:MAG: hypothetical protein DRG33_07735 [Deltaproteobacteria bacterium]